MFLNEYGADIRSLLYLKNNGIKTSGESCFETSAWGQSCSLSRESFSGKTEDSAVKNSFFNNAVVYVQKL